jgi:hypothetical protein
LKHVNRASNQPLYSSLEKVDTHTHTHKKTATMTHVFIHRCSCLVPLPIPFNYQFQSNVLTIIAESPPNININSSYEFNLKYQDPNAPTILITYAKVSYINPRLHAVFQYALIPNLTYVMTFVHTAPSVGYTDVTERLSAGRSHYSYSLPFFIDTHVCTNSDQSTISMAGGQRRYSSGINGHYRLLARYSCFARSYSILNYL